MVEPRVNSLYGEVQPNILSGEGVEFNRLRRFGTEPTKFRPKNPYERLSETSWFVPTLYAVNLALISSFVRPSWVTDLKNFIEASIGK